MRDNDDKALRRQAERIHLQSSSSANTTSTPNAANTTESTKSPTNSEPQSANNTLSTITADGTNAAESGKPVEQKGNVSEPEKNTKDNKNGLKAVEEEEDDYPADSSDKLWDDVDKDLGDILRETEAGGKSSDDEDSRYDRFRNSDKKQQHPGKDNEKNEIDEKGTIKKEVKVKLEKLDM